VKPVWRILIPTTQLSILSQVNPNLKVFEISGAGSFSGVQSNAIPFTYGIFRGHLSGRAEISWAAGGNPANSAPIPDILADLRKITTVADAVIDTVTFYEPAVINVHGFQVGLKLRFDKGNVHPQIFRKLTESPPGIPLADTYDLLVKFKQSLKSLPKEARKHWKPGYLLLTSIPSHPHLMNDPYLMQSAIQARFPGSILVTNIVKTWNMRDLMSLLSFKAAVPNIATTPITP
jgi:hypothetical protein